MTNVYESFLHRYRVLTVGRVLLLLVVLAVFWFCTAILAQADAATSYPSVSFSPRRSLMLGTTSRKPIVTVSPGSFEFSNLRQRVPASAVLDFSGSMNEFALQLPGVWAKMVEFLHERPHERLAVELACCPFASDVAFQDYAPTSFYVGKRLTFGEMGLTALGTAINTVIAHTRTRRQMLAAEGIDSLRAVCVVITDGCANDHPYIEQAIEEIRVCEEEGEIEFVPITPCPEISDVMVSIFGKDPIPLDGLDYADIFRSLARSLSQYSQSSVGQEPSMLPMLKNKLRDIDL